MNNVNNFQIAKVRPQGVGICLIFCQFQPGVADNSVAYKKEHVFKNEKNMHNRDKNKVEVKES